MVSGEKNILWPGQVKWFAKSSGTTNDKSKFIPVSNESLHKCHYKAALDVFALYVKNNPDTKILPEKNLQLVEAKALGIKLQLYRDFQLLCF
jgi:hypothetical protein